MAPAYIGRVRSSSVQDDSVGCAYPSADGLEGLRSAYVSPGVRAILDTPLPLFLSFPTEFFASAAVCRLWLAELLSPTALKAVLRRRQKKETERVLDDKLRPLLWRLLALDVAADRDPRPCYAALAAQPCTCEEAIARDLARTFPDAPRFQVREGRESLCNVLRAAANFRKDIGYCQGMNFVAATLLLALNRENDAFQAIRALFVRLSLDDVYAPGLPRIQVLARCFDALVEGYLPRLHERLQMINISSEYYSAHWWLTLFAYDLPFGDTLLEVWDFVWVDGWKMVHRVGLTLLWLAEERLLAIEDSDEFMFVLRRFARGEQQGSNTTCAPKPKNSPQKDIVGMALQFGVSNRMCQDLELCINDDKLLQDWFTRNHNRFKKMPSDSLRK